MWVLGLELGSSGWRASALSLSGHCSPPYLYLSILYLGAGENGSGAKSTECSSRGHRLDSSTYIWCLASVCTSSSRSNALSCPPWALHTHGASQSIQTKSHAHKTLNSIYIYMVSEIRMTVTVFGTCPVTPLSVLQSCNNTTGRFTPFPSAFSSVLTSHSPLVI